MSDLREKHGHLCDAIVHEAFLIVEKTQWLKRRPDADSLRIGKSAYQIARKLAALYAIRKQVIKEKKLCPESKPKSHHWLS
ncbi:MAG: hypothetical protein ACXABY_06040 [Candidatus Thorarchaeota archaeon]|jgi:hypothetical protein